jgi:hypothetical protein
VHLIIQYTVAVSELCGLSSQCCPNECIFRSGKPWGVGILGRGVYEPGEGNRELVYEQPGNEVEGSCHSKEGSKYVEGDRTGEQGEQGEPGEKKQRKCSCTYPTSSRVHNRMLVMIE